ncbi:hypothetical protein [Kitasatospora sp. SolWspMP-SS2h]|uniref:hypothetical protein n=1 Tax=Kitasatospora sp. SolWspMP-SS2h TaxID=1305729 RepID=UPI0011B9397B|nr:hypothetical protein [Kitasatospora sp. SolWspMP-SS2h]
MVFGWWKRALWWRAVVVVAGAVWALLGDAPLWQRLVLAALVVGGAVDLLLALIERFGPRHRNRAEQPKTVQR